MSDLRKLTVSQFDAGVRRAVEARKAKIPSEFKVTVKEILAGFGTPAPANTKQIKAVRESKNKQLKDLDAYMKRMQAKRQTLVKLGKNATREEYLDAGLPLLDPKAIKGYIPR